MEYYRITIPIPKRPWLWIRFRIATILLLIVILALLLAWRRDHHQLQAEITRLRTPYPHYEAAQATGPPDVLKQTDSSLAWCPATADGGVEWLQLDYEQQIVPTAILVYENYVPGAVVRVTHPTLTGETILWQGTYSPTASPLGTFATLPVTNVIPTNRIRVYIDTGAVNGWQEIDAVGIVDQQGKTHWAKSAKASSTWNEPPVNQSSWLIE